MKKVKQSRFSKKQLGLILGLLFLSVGAYLFVWPRRLAINQEFTPEFGFFLKSVDQLHNIIEDLSIRVPNTIKNYKYFSGLKTHKWNYLPED